MHQSHLIFKINRLDGKWAGARATEQETEQTAER